MWSLNNWSKYYRQTLLFGALQDAQVNSVFNKYCVNLQGQVGFLLVSLDLHEALCTFWVMRHKRRMARFLTFSLTPGRWL